jgi:formate--tetrahydrofolate ligase
MTDIEIARGVKPRPIQAIAERLGIPGDAIIPYGRDKAKLPLDLMREARVQEARLILVTAISPTPSGEGKTTVSVGLADGLSHIGKRAAVALREPSLGPVFGMKGGAAGGGHTQVIPMEDINLHFTGDFSAVEKANNLLAALIDNNIQGRKHNVGLDPRTVTWKRVMDMNDRALRSIVSGLGGKNGGFMRETGFNITAASEIMAILCMAKDLADLQARMDRIYLGDTRDREPVFANALKGSAAMAILMKEAIQPNLVQTLEGTPAILHGGPFANIAQGTNSLIATKMAMSYADYVVTEAGFGADLGAEKFMNIKARTGGIAPRVAVCVATVKALKYHGSGRVNAAPDAEAVRLGVPNLEKHIENLQGFGVPVVVALNAFHTDTEEERAAIFEACAAKGVPCVLSEGWAKGGAGVADLAQAVVDAMPEEAPDLRFTYDLDQTLSEKIERIATRIYGADSVHFTDTARTQMARYEELGFGSLPICMAKTQKSLSDNERLLGRPTGFRITVREFEVAAGAGFVIPITGEMLRMPGLPAVPAAEGMTIDPDGTINGLS